MKSWRNKTIMHKAHAAAAGLSPDTGPAETRRGYEEGDMFPVIRTIVPATGAEEDLLGGCSSRWLGA